MWSFQVANDSDSTVIVNADTTGTVTVPAHRRAFVAGGRGEMIGGWRIELVDTKCHPLVTLTVSERDRWFYIAPDGQASLPGESRAGGLTEVSAEKLSHQCPLPRER
jgi:hypothetical protein